MKKCMLMIVSFILFLVGCSSQPQKEKQANKRSIFTTVYPLQYFAEFIGGEYVSVSSIYPPGADEHTFEPSQKDMMKLSESDLFIYIGLGLEGFVDKALPILKNSDTQILEVGKNLELPVESNHEDEHNDDHAHHHGDYDPHVWIDPIFSIQIAEQIKNSLTELLPEQEEYFHQQFIELKSNLEEIDQKFMQLTEMKNNKPIIVSHDAYGYWEHRYNLEIIPINGLSSASEPSQRDLQNIIDLAESNDIQYLLQEQNIQSRVIDVVKNEIKAKVLPLHNLSVLTENDIKNKENYFTLMEKNIESLTKALK